MYIRYIYFVWQVQQSIGILKNLHNNVLDFPLKLIPKFQSKYYCSLRYCITLLPSQCIVTIILQNIPIIFAALTGIGISCNNIVPIPGPQVISSFPSLKINYAIL